ncbi:MAG: tetratricopeptide repeat protein [Flavobacteriaceae bacterium]|nr:tetratricopeptide repeat protein [Flavobacteriaceae bacterium]
MNFKFLNLTLFLFTSIGIWSQTEASTNLIVEGNELHNQEEYIKAESEYRKSISLSPNRSEAFHNLGNTNYRIADYDEASQRFFQTQKNASSKEAKHSAFHNMGNVYMKQKDYAQAVQAFKNALRNNPMDEETRYNYALAKELLEKENQDQQNQEDNKDQNKEEDQDKKGDKEESKDEGEKKEKEDSEEGDSKEDSKEKPEDKKPKNPEKEGDGDQKKKSTLPPKQGQISPEQVKSLLEAMNNQEKGVQQKVNAQKAKGVPTKTKKDW